MKMNEKTISKKIICLICLVLIVLVFPVSAFAMTNVNTTQSSSLTVECKCDCSLLSGVVFGIYRVADMDEAGRFILSSDFEDYPISLKQDTASGWRALAETLAQYVNRDNVPSLNHGSTGADGKVTFADLKVGLYLVCGYRYINGDFTYNPEPFLISLPNLNESDTWIYDVKVNCKGEGYYDSPETTSIKVLKVWKNDEDTQSRPEQIEIQLLKNGKVLDTVILSAENSWRHTWTELDADFVWSVTEKTVPNDYTLLISKEGSTYVLTNTYTPEFTEVEVEKIWEDAGHESERSTSIEVQLLCDGKVYETVILNSANQWKYTWANLESGHEWKVKESSSLAHYTSKVTQDGGKFTIVNTFVPPDNPKKPPLPQTGQLWWPIPVLLGAGLLFIIIGICKRKRMKHDETKYKTKQ